MKVESKSALDSVYRAIDSLNQMMPPDKRISKSPDTPLGDELTSMDKVNLVVETEMAIEEEFGQSINLADQAAVAQGNRLFETVATFSAYVESLLAK